MTCGLGAAYAIGYLEPKKAPFALENAYKSLNDDGILIIEPWVSEDEFARRFICRL